MPRFWLLILLIGLLAGCAGMSESMEKFRDTTMAYERALRWGNYDMALAAHKDSKPMSESERKRLTKYHVSSYRILSNDIQDNQNRISQMIELRFYNEENAIERKMNVPLEWVHDKDTGAWRITSPFPVFK